MKKLSLMPMLAIVLSSTVTATAKAETEENTEAAMGGASGVVVTPVDSKLFPADKNQYEDPIRGGEKWVDTRLGTVCYAVRGSYNDAVAISCMALKPPSIPKTAATK